MLNPTECWNGTETGGVDPQTTAEATIARIRQEWAPVIAALVSDRNGDTTSAAQLDRFLQRLGAQQEWQVLSEILGRIRAGEREPISLLAGLDAVDTLIIRDVLEALGVPLDAVLAGGAEPPGAQPEPEPAAEPPAATDSPSADSEAAQLRAAEATVARIRQEWAPVIAALVADSQGDATSALQLERFLEKLGQQEEWQALSGLLRRIRTGERDPMVLLEGLDAVDTLIIRDVLEALGVSLDSGTSTFNVEGVFEEPSPEEARFGSDDEPPVHGDSVSLDEFISMVALACSSEAPAGLSEQLYGAVRGMASQPDASEEIRALGRVLGRILIGDRNPDLTGLSAGLIGKIRTLLGTLGKKQ